MRLLAKAAGGFIAAMALAAWRPDMAAATPISGLNAYAPYEFLIGNWTSAPGGENGPVIRQNFRWGPKRSYIFYSTYTRAPGQPEDLHFEGMMVWNGASHGLDFLFVVEPGSGIQEKGTARAEADGSVVREVTLTATGGTSSTFRQTFRKTGDHEVVTSLMRQTATGWEPTFAGSDRLVMTRQALDAAPSS